MPVWRLRKATTNPWFVPEGSLEDDDFEGEENPFYVPAQRGFTDCGGLEDMLLHALYLNNEGTRVEVLEFFGKMHSEDYLECEATLQNYFDWKPMVEKQKVLFVKLKLKGNALLWWKRIEEQLFVSLESLKRAVFLDSDLGARRITSNVKQNLQFLKLWREFHKKKSSTPKPATSYRKKKGQKEEQLEDTELYLDPTVTLYYTSQGIETAVPVLLVDGYNVCGYWTKLKKHFMNGRLDIARQKLIDELITFSTLREVKVVVVFDALMSRFPTHKEDFAGIDVVFSSESCADAWIEKEVVALKEDGCPKVWVVTSDRCQQQAAHGAGAFIWSSKALVTEEISETCFRLLFFRCIYGSDTMFSVNLDVVMLRLTKNLIIERDFELLGFNKGYFGFVTTF
ncbi:hypothetical protein IFM89_039647 [Coptis chinensis]|uniref:NYN domain-containing protein n=1 Tax=Coptis chinensis TaxID=261450 RepID=A0A835GVC2_9MAGN|nr:hypothetical protein IFM89_039647 [Coptis chinensis]